MLNALKTALNIEPHTLLADFVGAAALVVLAIGVFHLPGLG
ncbi:MAG: hypothetical protein AAGA87_06250 [Pseudomonadota bacterium]